MVTLCVANPRDNSVSKFRIEAGGAGEGVPERRMRMWTRGTGWRPTTVTRSSLSTRPWTWSSRNGRSRRRSTRSCCPFRRRSSGSSQSNIQHLTKKQWKWEEAWAKEDFAFEEKDEDDNLEKVVVYWPVKKTSTREEKKREVECIELIWSAKENKGDVLLVAITDDDCH